MELTGGVGVDATLECVGTGQSMRDGARDRAPRLDGRLRRRPARRRAADRRRCSSATVGVRGGAAPARVYIPELLDDVLEGRINPGRVLDYETDLDGIADAYAAMDERRAIKSLVRVGSDLMSAWTTDELRRVAGADELEIAPVRRSGELRRPTPIWAVQVDDALYVRAAYTPDEGWHGVARTSGRARISAGGVERDVSVEDAEAAILDRVDAAYRKKYGGRYASIVDKINAPAHRASTLRLLPEGSSA